MQSSVSFSGLPLTEIFQIQSLQSLLIKYWYLGLNSDCLVAKEDITSFKAIRKSLTFANCFSFQMPLRTYINFIEKIMKAINQLNPKPIFEELLSHLRNNKIISISFELFGIALLQLFGRILESINSQIMGRILRKIYMELTNIGKSGTAILKADKSLIRQIDFNQFVPDFDILKNQPISLNGSPQKNGSLMQNPQTSVEFQPKNDSYSLSKMKTLKGRLESQHDFNVSLREGSTGQYPTGQKMKNQEKTNLSCFVMGGFEIVDYSDSINQLHKKLLTKILLNK